LAGGIAALPRPAAADLIIDLRINPTGSTGVVISGDSKTGTVSGPATVVVDVYGTVTDANPASVSINAVGGSFLSTGPIQGSFAPNGATGWSGTGIPPEGTTQLVGLRTASYDFSGTGSQPGTIQDIDADGDNDLGSPNANAPDGFVYMREASPDNTSGTLLPAGGGKEWKIGSVIFTSTGTGADTQLKFEPRRNAAGQLVPETAWWFEGDMVSGTNPDGIAFPGLAGSVLDTANAFVTITSGVVPDVQWTGGPGGAGTDYDTAANWSGPVPSGSAAVARFHTGDANAGAVVLATQKTLGVISFDNATSYILSGAAITLDNGANPARIVVTNGSHQILNPISGAALSIERAPTGGTLTLGKLTTTGPLTIPAAQAVVINPNGTSAGSGKVGGLTIGAGGSLDLKDNDLVVVNTVATGVRDMIASGLLKTTQAPPAGKTTTLGWAQGNDPNLAASLAGQLSGQSFGPADTLVKYTYHGDADLDGDVDPNDVAHWGVNFTGDLPPGTGTKTWTQGDWDGDRDVDPNDVALWGVNFTGDLPPGTGLSIDVPAGLSSDAVAALSSLGFSVNVVPEPGVLGLLGLLGAGLLSRRNRRS